MHVLIIEPLLSGHRAVYLERIVEGFVEDGHVVTLCMLAREMWHPVIARLTAAHPQRLSVFPIEDDENGGASSGRYGNALREFAMRELLGRLYRRVNGDRHVDYVFIPFLDYCLYAIGLQGSPFGECEWSGITMRPSFHYQFMGVMAPVPAMWRVKRFLFRRVLQAHGLRAIFTIDELFARYAQAEWPALSGQVQYIPDPAELVGSHSYESARRELGIEESDRVVLCYGAIDKRKAVDVLLTGVREAESSNLVVLVVGKQSDWAKELLSASAHMALTDQARLRVIDRFVSEEDQQMVFAACDAVWLGYREHYTMSGVLILAAQAGRAVIAFQEGLIGWYVSNHGLGYLVSDPLHGLVHALRIVAQNGRPSGLPLDKFGNHTWSEFIRRLLAAPSISLSSRGA